MKMKYRKNNGAGCSVGCGYISPITNYSYCEYYFRTFATGYLNDGTC